MVRGAQYNTAPTLVYTFGTIDQLINHILGNWETCFVPFRPDPGAGCDVSLETGFSKMVFLSFSARPWGRDGTKIAAVPLTLTTTAHLSVTLDQVN